MPQEITPRRLFKWGVILLVIAIASRIVLDDVLVNLSRFLNTSNPSLALIFLVVNLVSAFTLPLGAALFSGGLVLQGLTGRQRGTDDRETRTAGQ